LDYRRAQEDVQNLSERYGLAVRPDARVESIGVAQQARVEILKALYRSARLHILDEPTAVLTPQETHELFDVIRSLTEQGTSIIFITHKLGEVLEVSDRITVLRRGKAVATVATAGSSERELAELMVGRPVLLRVEKGAAQPAPQGIRRSRRRPREPGGIAFGRKPAEGRRGAGDVGHAAGAHRSPTDAGARRRRNRVRAPAARRRTRARSRNSAREPGAR